MSAPEPPAKKVAAAKPRPKHVPEPEPEPAQEPEEQHLIAEMLGKRSEPPPPKAASKPKAKTKRVSVKFDSMELK